MKQRHDDKHDAQGGRPTGPRSPAAVGTNSLSDPGGRDERPCDRHNRLHEPSPCDPRVEQRERGCRRRARLAGVALTRGDQLPDEKCTERVDHYDGDGKRKSRQPGDGTGESGASDRRAEHHPAGAFPAVRC
jgi:hypothetical protein